MSICLPPLNFKPIIKPTPWGGRKLKTTLKKSLPPSKPCGESWEIVDLPDDQSILETLSTELNRLFGTRATIHDMLTTAKQTLIGSTPLLMERFPLLFKYLDARETLSVQVHPDWEACRRIGGGARPKTEAWYILEVEEGAKLYLGLKENVSLDQLRQGIRTGQVEKLLYTVEPKPGDFYHLPAGMLHAIGGGILLAEIQQSSDTTYRVFDWNRVGFDGKPRPLHIENALLSINPDLRGKIKTAAPASGYLGVTCNSFSFEEVVVETDKTVKLAPEKTYIVSCLSGTGLARTSVGDKPLSIGQTCLLTASSKSSLLANRGSKFLVIAF